MSDERTGLDGPVILRGHEDTEVMVLVMVRIELSVTVFDVDLDLAAFVVEEDDQAEALERIAPAVPFVSSSLRSCKEEAGCPLPSSPAPLRVCMHTFAQNFAWRDTTQRRCIPRNPRHAWA